MPAALSPPPPLNPPAPLLAAAGSEANASNTAPIAALLMIAKVFLRMAHSLPFWGATHFGQGRVRKPYLEVMIWWADPRAIALWSNSITWRS
jgi:hypothetical protein